MELNTWLIYLGVISAIIFLPGPSALLCISHGLKHGHLKALATVVGGAVAALILMMISIVGLGAILAASEKAFLMVKLIGATYLIYLGVSAWKDSFSAPHKKDIETQDLPNTSVFSLFTKGFMVGISNPKDLLFFAALLPSFISHTLPHAEQYLALASTWFVVDVSAMFMYASLGNKVGSWFSNARNLRIFDRTTGTIFIATGCALAISTRLKH